MPSVANIPLSMIRTMQHKVLKIAPQDHVLVALQDLSKGYA